MESTFIRKKEKSAGSFPWNAVFLPLGKFALSFFLKSPFLDSRFPFSWIPVSPFPGFPFPVSPFSFPLFQNPEKIPIYPRFPRFLNPLKATG